MRYRLLAVCALSRRSRSRAVRPRPSRAAVTEGPYLARTRRRSRSRNPPPTSTRRSLKCSPRPARRTAAADRSSRAIRSASTTRRAKRSSRSSRSRTSPKSRRRSSSPTPSCGASSTSTGPQCGEPRQQGAREAHHLEGEMPRGSEGHRPPDRGAEGEVRRREHGPRLDEGQGGLVLHRRLRVPEQGVRAPDGVGPADVGEEGLRAPGQAPLLATSSGTSPAAATPRAATTGDTPTAARSISTICHTNLRHRHGVRSPECDTRRGRPARPTPSRSGAFPKCSSRFGVFDQHGNVAEVMMRREGDQALHAAQRQRVVLRRAREGAGTSPSPRRRRTRPARTPITATSIRDGTSSRSKRRCT